MQGFNNNNNFSGRGGFGGRGRGRGGFGAGVFRGGVGVAPVQCFSCGVRSFLASRGCSNCGRPGNAVGGGPLVAQQQLAVRPQVVGGAERQVCGVCRVGKVCPHGQNPGAASGSRWQGPSVRRSGGAVSTVEKRQGGEAGVETRKFKGGLNKMWAGAKFAEGSKADVPSTDRNKWFKYQCYTVASHLGTTLDGVSKAEVSEVEVTLRSNTLVGKGIVAVALAGMSEDKSLGFESIDEIAGARRFTLDELRSQLVRVKFRVTEDLSGMLKPEAEVGKRPRVVIRVMATKDCIEESVATLTYKVKVNAVVGKGASQLA